MNVLILFVGVILALMVYFLPTMVANSRHHVNATAIFVTNLLLGLTGIGWAVALIWAFTNTTAPASPSIESQKSGMGGFVKVISSVVVVLLLFVVVVNIFGRHPPSGHGNTASAPAVETGVPQPADSIIGK